MTLSHLNQLKPTSFSKLRFSQSIRWLSSSSNPEPNSEKISTALKKKNASVVELFNKCMETHPGISQIGGSLHNVKDVILNLKEKVIGKSGASLSNVVNTLSDGSKLSTAETSKDVVTIETNDLALTTKDDKNYCDLGSSEPSQIESSAQSNIQAPATDYHAIKKTTSEASLPCTTVECSSVNTLDSSSLELPKRSKINEKAHEENITDSSGSLDMVATLSGQLQLGESSNLVSKLQRDPESQVKKTLQGIATEKSVLTESESQTDVIASNSKSNLGSEREISERTGSSSKDMGLTELLTTCLSGWPEVNPKQPDETLTSTLLRSEVDQSSKSTQSQIKKILQQFGEEMTSSADCRSHRPDIQGELKGLPNIVSEAAVTFKSTENAKTVRCKELFRKRTKHQESGQMMADVKGEILRRNIFKDSVSDTQKEVAKDSNISGLIGCLKNLPHSKQLGLGQTQGNNESMKLDQLRNSDLIDEAQRQLSDSKGKQTLSNKEIVVEKKEIEHGLNKEVSPNNIKSTLNSNLEVPISKSRKATSSVNPVLNENKAILRFLPPTIEENEIAIAFKNRDDIVKIECSPVNGRKFKTAQVYFKTRNGLQEALKTAYPIVGTSTVIIEAACLTNRLSNRIRIPDLIGDPDAPAMLLKNPSNTIMIKDLTEDISSHHIQDALLDISKSEISAFFYGSTNSVAYVEFKTEEGKERALAKQSILVDGKQLSIFRVDAPRTTVVRITSKRKIYSFLNEIVGLCKTYGQVKSVSARGMHSADVHFNITEWPNMLKILNRLNGQLVDGQRVEAKAAPVFPPVILHALWGHPEERRRLKGLMFHLFKKLEEDYVTKTNILDLATRYYRDDND